MDISPHAKLLGSITMFSSVPPEDLEDLASALTVRKIEKEGDVFRQGDKGSKLYVVEDGEVEISVGEAERKVVLASLFKGQTFGEMSILDGSPRSATARAPKPTTLLELDRKHFVEFLKRRPLASIYIMAELGDRMRATNDILSRQLAKSDEGGGAGVGGGGGRTLLDSACRALGSPAGFLSIVGVAAVLVALDVFGPDAGSALSLLRVYASLLGFSLFPAAMLLLLLYHQNRQAERVKSLADNGYRVNLKNEVSIEAVLRKQGEILQRVSLVERRIGLDFESGK